LRDVIFFRCLQPDLLPRIVASETNVRFVAIKSLMVIRMLIVMCFA